MKSSVIKKIFVALATVMAIVMLFSVTAFAEDYGNFSYTPVKSEENEFDPYNEISGYNAGDDATDTVVVIPDMIEDVPVTRINAGAFSGKSTLTEVVIPDTVTSIANAAFINCTNLKIVVIPDSVTYIGDSAFQGCESLEYVVIGNGVKDIGSLAFKNCKSLKSVDLGTSVETIGSGAFFGCDALAEIYVPDSVKNIGSLAFGFVQDGNAEKAVNGFTFYTNDSAAVAAYDTANAVVEDVSSVVSAFVINKGVNACADDAHAVSYVNIRPATDAYEGLDVAQCATCKAIVTRANTEVAPVEKGVSSYISLIIGVLAVVAVVAYTMIYVKKSKKHREVAIAEYKAGKTLSDMALKEENDAKLEAKYQKKRAKQEKRLEIFK